MRARSILLRLLLCLALVVNGLSAVHAGVGMAADGSAHATLAAHDAQSHEAEPSCHDTRVAMQDDAAAEDDARTSPAPASDDCCLVGCLCSCVSSAPTLMPAHPVAAASLPDARPACVLGVSHASPTLPYPIRPPIG